MDGLPSVIPEQIDPIGRDEQSNRSPLIATIVSPGCNPAAAAGDRLYFCELDAHQRRRKPDDPREDHEREQDVHDDARDEDASLTGRLFDEKARGSSALSPSSPSSLTKPPIGSQFSV